MRYLNGDIYYYCEDMELNQTRFFNDLRTVLSRDCGWECTFRIRVSCNWSVKAIFGNYAVVSTDLLSVGNIDETKTLLYEFTMNDEPLNDGFFIQVSKYFSFLNKIKYFLF